MEFANPLLLGGAALAALPVILHLVMRQKPKHLAFPALRFLQVRQMANRRKLRLRHLLLLALRVGAICLLAFAMARPSVKSTGTSIDSEAPIAAALVFDTSPRMQYRHENHTRLEVAQDMALWLLKQLPAESQIAVLDSRGGAGVFQVDLGSANERVGRLEVAMLGEPLTNVIEEAVRLLARSDKTRKEIYVFTDLSRAAWPNTAPGALKAQLEQLTDRGVYLIDVGVEAPRNDSLGSLKLTGQIVAKNSPLIVRTDLSRVGPVGERGVELVLLDKSGVQQVRSRASVTAGPGQTQPLEFSLGALEPGLHQGAVRLTGADSLTADDARYFSIEVKPAWPVLIVAGKPASERARYLRQALAPDRFRTLGLARFECKVIDYEALASEPLEKFAAICLVDPGVLDATQWGRLSAYAVQGGGVAIFLGRHASPDEPFNSASARELLPGSPSAIKRGGGQVTLGEGRHPMLTKFRELTELVPWDLSPVDQYWQFGDVSPNAAIVARFQDGGAALYDRHVGRGRVLTLTTPVSEAPDEPGGAWNQLLTGIEAWPAMMLVNEMMFYLVGSAEGQLNYAVGQTAALPLSPGEQISQYVLVTPTGDRLRRTASGNEEAITITATDWPGHYRALAGGDESGFDRGFSVNLAPEATDLTRALPMDLQNLLGAEEYRLARDRAGIERVVSHGRVGRELYGLIFILVSLTLAGEYLMSNRFYRDD